MPAYVKALFVGGPKDGQYISVREDRKFFQAPEPINPSISNSAFKTVIYHQETICTPKVVVNKQPFEPDQYHYQSLMILEGISTAEAIEMILNYYGTKAEREKKQNDIADI